jgi:uncharacterized repeat protein (TIGR01451 family)
MADVLERRNSSLQRESTPAMDMARCIPDIPDYPRLAIWQNPACLAATLSGGNTASTSATAITTAEDGANLQVQQSGPADTAPGATVTYHQTLTNNGPDAATNVVLGDPLECGLTLDSQTQTSGPALTLSSNGNSLSDSIASLASGASATFSIDATVGSSLPTGYEFANTASASSATADPNPADGSATVLTTVQYPAAVAVSLNGPDSATPGTDVTYTLTVSNGGSADAQNVTLTDTLPGGETFVSQAQTAGPSFTLSNSGATINDTLADLPAGDSATFTITAQVGSSVPGGTLLEDSATASASNSDSSTDYTAALVNNGLSADAGPDQSTNLGSAVSFSGSYTDNTGGTVSSSGIKWDFNYDGTNFVADPAGADTMGLAGGCGLLAGGAGGVCSRRAAPGLSSRAGGGGTFWTGWAPPAAGLTGSTPGAPMGGGGTGRTGLIRSCGLASDRPAFWQNRSRACQNLVSPVSSVTVRSFSLFSGSCSLMA